MTLVVAGMTSLTTASRCAFPCDVGNGSVDIAASASICVLPYDVGDGPVDVASPTLDVASPYV
jgi:hypothetical protein